ncbi:hypothetical protein COCON_G00198390 [Conger conger]|uniref:Uncharacterized protein n=1 Tax=Conger conger TaxID=82655 RepID=A0A9Q1D1R9_CONCO|nr:hypothetical protein COCON_G00198390 [Conger conger]
MGLEMGSDNALAQNVSLFIPESGHERSGTKHPSQIFQYAGLLEMTAVINAYPDTDLSCWRSEVPPRGTTVFWPAWSSTEDLQVKHILSGVVFSYE